MLILCLRPFHGVQLARRGGGRNLHDDVDALDDGGWWEGRVTQVLKQRCKVQPFVSNALLTVRREDVRTGVVWDAQGWSARQAAGEDVLRAVQYVCCTGLTGSLNSPQV